MPAVPGNAIQVFVVLSEAVEDSVEVGVRAAVVPVPTWHKKQSGAGKLGASPAQQADSATCFMSSS